MARCVRVRVRCFLSFPRLSGISTPESPDEEEEEEEKKEEEEEEEE